MRLCLVALCLLVPLPAAAEGPTPGDLSFKVFLPTGVATRYFQCFGADPADGDPTYRPAITSAQRSRLKADPMALLDCDIQEVSVSKDKAPEVLTNERRQEVLASLKKTISDKGGWAKYKQAQIRELKKDTYYEDALKVNSNEAKQKAIADDLAALSKFRAAFAACESIECGSEVLFAMQSEPLSADTVCRIAADHRTLRFERVGSTNRWVYTDNRTTNSRCGGISTYTLEFTPKASFSTWTYVIKWIYTNPNGFDGTPLGNLCKHDGQESYFSDVVYAQKAKLDCLYISPF